MVLKKSSPSEPSITRSRPSWQRVYRYILSNCKLHTLRKFSEYIWNTSWTCPQNISIKFGGCNEKIPQCLQSSSKFSKTFGNVIKIFQKYLKISLQTHLNKKKIEVSANSVFYIFINWIIVELAKNLVIG